MTGLFILGAGAILLFLGAYFTKRRFGMLGLALAGGAVLADIWAPTAGLLLQSQGLSLEFISVKNLATIIITLLPAVLFLLRGPSYNSKLLRLGAALLFVVVSLAFVIDSLRPLLNLGEIGSTAYGIIYAFRELIISGGLLVAFVDIFFVKSSRDGKPTDSKH